MPPKKNQVSEELPSTTTEEPTVSTMQDHLEWVTILMDPMNHITNWKVEIWEKFQIELVKDEWSVLTSTEKVIATVTMIDWDWRPHFDIMFNPNIAYAVERLPVPTVDTDQQPDTDQQLETNSPLDDGYLPENPRLDWSYWVPIVEDTSTEEHTHTIDSSGNTVACCQQDPNTPAETTPPVIKTPRSEIRNKL